MSRLLRVFRLPVRAVRALRVLAPILVVAGTLFIGMRFALADARTDFFVKMLSTSSQFRVRAQAALALGSRPNEPAVHNALARGLKDEHPAVRAASASAFESLRDQSARPLLEVAKKDNDKSVRAAVTRALGVLASAKPSGTAVATTPTPPVQEGGSFYVAVGVPSAKVSGVGDTITRDLRTHVSNQLLQIAGVRIAPSGESTADAQRVLSQRRLTGYHLESSITTLERKPDGSLRAQVSVVVATYPGRDIRSMLTGGATIVGAGSSDADKVEVISAAFTSALRRLPQAMQAGLARAP